MAWIPIDTLEITSCMILDKAWDSAVPLSSSVKWEPCLCTSFIRQLQGLHVFIGIRHMANIMYVSYTVEAPRELSKKYRYLGFTPKDFVLTALRYVWFGHQSFLSLPR